MLDEHAAPEGVQGAAAGPHVGGLPMQPPLMHLNPAWHDCPVGARRRRRERPCPSGGIAGAMAAVRVSLAGESLR